jgi:hypothetical protein
MKRTITLTESELQTLVKESVCNILNEWGISKNDTPEVKRLSDMLLCPHAVQMQDNNGNEIVVSAYYKPQDLQKLYSNQDGLVRFERIVLKQAMWGRAMRANYHGYDKDWGIVWYKNGDFYVNGPNGKTVTASNGDFKRICTPEYLSEPTTASTHML